MERFLRDHFRKGVIWLAVFILFTLLIKVIDVKPIGPEESKVGFAALNGFVSGLLKQHPFFEKLTKLLGIFALLTAAGFAAVGVLQFVRTRSLRGVDREILLLGAFYVVVLLAYIFFELCVVNYRPVILDEGLEASYPSSHTVLVICIMMTAPAQIGRLTKNALLRETARIASYCIIAVMVVGRLISGVHWFTDIIGGILLSGALVCIYNGAMEYFAGGIPGEETGIKKKSPARKAVMEAGGKSGSHSVPEEKNRSGNRPSGKGGAHLAK